MTIAVVGGTGTAGRAVVERALERGLLVRIIGRHQPTAQTDGAERAPAGLAAERAPVEFARADLTTGSGLAEALKGVEAVIDCSNVTTMNERAAVEFFTTGTRNLFAAEAAAGVPRHVLISIVGIDDIPAGYYRGKMAQEKVAREAAEQTGVAVSIVRATQFHDFPNMMLSQLARGPIAIIPTIPIQPVDTHDVADVLLDAATGKAVDDTAVDGRVDIGGPARESLVHLARRTVAAQGRRVLVVPLPVPGKLGRALRAGALIPSHGLTGSITFSQWLARTYPN
jgi:nucleoside-diphosphate-sugar epimerase